MTAAVLRSSPNLAVPQTQNTAPVHEFNCLYTHDLRRKQKRWQDGFLRYHTFNKRVMVYDVPRNFLGDLHWTDGDDLQEGDEMTLEKGGIMVQVSDRIATIQTDLSELLQRKDRTPAKKPAPAPSSRRPTPHSLASSVTPRTPQGIPQTPMKHKSLNALLGRSRRPIGKASMPTESPFEARNRELQARSDEREAKRQKVSAATKTPKTASVKAVQEVIDISSDTEDPLAAQAADHAIDAELLAMSSPAPLESPAHARKHSLQRRSEKETSVVMNPAKLKLAEPPVGDAPLKKNKVPSTESGSQMRGKTLRLIGGAPRKMLLFQSQSSRPASSETEAVDSNIALSTKETSASDTVNRGIETPTDKDPEDTTFKQRIQERLARIEKKQRTAGLQRSSADTIELRPDDEATTASRSGLGKTSSVIIPQHAFPAVQEDDNLFDDFNPLTHYDPISDAPIRKLPPASKRVFQTNAATERTTTARSFKPPQQPLVTKVKAAATKVNTLGNEAVQAMIAAEKKKNEDVGPWSKEAFDLMDWRPPNLQVEVGASGVDRVGG
jgi:hypothetical protein